MPQALRSDAPHPLPIDKEHRASVRAGLFLVGAAVAAAIVVLLLGNAHRLFKRNVEYAVHFADVEGLKLDSPVRLGGLTVGSVEAISFSTAMDDTRVLVRLKVAREFSSRVRTDSIARVASRGLLGDKTVDISIGSDEGKPVPEGGELVAGMGGDIGSVLKASTEVVGNVVTISNDLRKAIASFTTPEVRRDVTNAVSSVTDILATVSKGKGALHSLIYDPKTGADLDTLLASASKTAVRLDAAVVKADALLEEVRSGDGTAHALLYGPEGKRALAELGGTAAAATKLLEELRRSENSAVHELMFGDSKALVEDLSRSATSLKNITARVDRGDGSLGALINDPTAYEDLKTILGNVKRNRLLRELVRLTVSNRAEYEQTGTPQTTVEKGP